MIKVYEIHYINRQQQDDYTQLNATNIDELTELIDTLKDELEIDRVIKYEEAGCVRYYITVLGYDENNNVTDYEYDMGDFDEYDEAKKVFDDLSIKDIHDIIYDIPKGIKFFYLNLEECEETDDGIECIDLREEVIKEIE